MKILMIPSWYPTDQNPLNGIFFKEQAQALQRYGHDVVVAFPKLNRLSSILKNRDSNHIQCRNEDGLLTFRLSSYNYSPNIPRITNLLYYKLVKKLFTEVVRQKGFPDIIHAHSCLLGGWAGAKLSREQNIPFIVTEHASIIGKNTINEYQRKLVGDTTFQAKKVLVVGPGLEKQMLNYTTQDKVEIIPNMVDTTFFSLSNTVRKKKNKFRFLSIAFLSFNKGMDILIQAFARAFKDMDVELVVVGDGFERPKLESLVISCKIESQVSFLGNLKREDVKNEMQYCDAFVLASRYETFGVVYIEALACGKPIIATSCGGPAIIVDEENGLLVPVEDINALSEAMRYLFTHYENYNPAIIRNNCINKYSEEVIIGKISDIYNESLK